MKSIVSKITFFRRVFGEHSKSSDGINFAFKCPKCSMGLSTKKKLVIRLDNDAYHCWVCGIKGKNLRFLLRKYYPGFLHEYQTTYQPNHIESITPFQVEEIILPQLPPNFISLVQAQNGDPDVLAVKQYARKRNLTLRDLWYFRLGTCKMGRYRRRLIIPSFNIDGHVNYYVARAIDKHTKRKYLNPKIAKKNIIFNEINIDWNKELTLVEGPFDLMKCDENATCLLGSNLSVEYALFQKIVKNQTPIILALDTDARSKAHDFAKLFSEYGVHVKIMNIVGYNDVGEMTRNVFKERKITSVKWESNDRLFHLINKMGSGSII